MRGRCSRIVKRVIRSTRVPIAELKSEDKISLPVTGHRPISNLRGALADHDLGGDKGFSFAVDPRSRHAQGTAGAEAGGQLAPQCASALNVKGLVNRLVT